MIRVLVIGEGALVVNQGFKQRCHSNRIASHLVNPGYLGGLLVVHLADDINLFPFVGKRPICQLPRDSGKILLQP